MNFSSKPFSRFSAKGSLRFLGLLLLFLFFHPFCRAQFYTGSDMAFGRKRVQYEKFVWMYYRFEGFDVYFTSQGKNLALYTASYVQNHLSEMENRVGFQTREGLRFIVFNRLTDLKQSNIGYLDEKSESSSNTGGITRFLDNKVFLYFEGDYVDFERQIRQGMAELLVSQAITGAKVGSQYKNSYLMDLPRWFTGGAASFFGREWDEEMDERMATAIRQKNYRYFSSLEGEDAVFAGHSFWHFVARTYGEDAVSRCIRVVSTERNMKKTFNIALNISFKDLMDQWYAYYRYLYTGERHDSLLSDQVLKRTNRTDHTYDRFVLNPAGKEAAFVANKLGRAKVYLQSMDPPRRFCIYRTGAAINDNPDYSFPLLCFHPNGKMLGVMTEEKGRTVLIVYEIDRNEKGNFRRRPVRRHTMRYYLDAFDKINSFSFSPDGRQIALGGTLNGYPDIYLYRLGAGTRQRITFDLYDDYDPVFVPGTGLLVFSSNRPSDTLKKGEKFDVAPSFPSGRNLYAYDLENPSDHLFPMTKEDFRTLLSQPRVVGEGTLAFLSNKYGQTNLAAGRLGKTISHIDTAIHYRNTFSYATLTDWDPGLFSFDASQDRGMTARAGRLVGDKGRFMLGTDSLSRIIPSSERALKEISVQPSRFKKALWEKERKRKARLAYRDSLRRAAEQDTAGELAKSLAWEKARKEFLSLHNTRTSELPVLTAYDAWLLKRAGILRKSGNPPGEISSKVSDTVTFSTGLSPSGPSFSLPTDGIPLDTVSGKYPAADEVKSKTAEEEGMAEPDAFLSDTAGMKGPLLQAWKKYQRVLAGRTGGRIPVLPYSDTLHLDLLRSGEGDTGESFPKIPPKQHMYEVEYMVNSSTAQLGFDYLNACYQQFTNSKNPIYLNPTVSGLTQISISDLMENHRIIGGFAFSLDFSSTEYLFSYEYLERRLGHQLILHMSNLNDNSYYPYRQNTYDAYYVMKYPITPVSSLRGTVFGRYDRSMYRAIDYASLTAEVQNELRVGLKGEWVYDHSRFITQNIYFGTRGKIWLEYYQGVWNNKQNLFVFGLDFRDYRRLYKTLIWANRVAFSHSFGQQKLVYYMGGVDSWIGARFNQDVETDPNQNYAYQTLATNMRGFTQNIRNGNTFAVINSEIRFPIVQVLSPRPVQSSFLRHLQLVLFGDVGSAWSGWNPWSKDNLFYKKTIEDGKLTVVLDKDANPIVGGFGLGLRMQVLGYFLRGDVAWGVENGMVHKKPVFYFSLSTDF